MRAAEVLRLVSGALQDLEPGLESRWPWEGGDDGRIGLLDFLNDALRAVGMQRPDAFAVTEPIRLEPGMRQRLPRRRNNSASHDAVALIELVRNLGEDGETPGPIIVSVQPTLLLAWTDEAILRPSRFSQKVPHDIIEEWGDILAYGALAKIKAMSGKGIEWSDPQGAGVALQLYNEGTARAKGRVIRSRIGSGELFARG